MWDEFVDAHPKGSVFHTSEIIRVYEHTKGHRPLASPPSPTRVRFSRSLLRRACKRFPTRSDRFHHARSGTPSRSAWMMTSASAPGKTRYRARSHHAAQRAVHGNPPAVRWTGTDRAEQCGYQYLDYLNFIIDLSGDHDAVWKRMRRDARRSVQKSEKAGCEAYDLDAVSNVEQLYQFLQLSYNHAGVPMADISLFHSAVKYLRGRVKLRVTAVRHNDEVLTMGATLTYKDLSFDWYCGTVRRPQFSPVDLLKWHEFCRSQDDGCTKFDMGGAGKPDDPTECESSRPSSAASSSTMAATAKSIPRGNSPLPSVRTSGAGRHRPKQKANARVPQ